jgi:nucleoside-diphosphate-sugar epimerase
LGNSPQRQFIDFIKPAVNGTLGVLKSALKNGSTVKRIIITSSCAAVYTVQSEPGCWSETDWNDAALEQVRAQGKNADVMVKYRASKVLAERAAWDFYKEHQWEVGWDLVVLNPPIVFGVSWISWSTVGTRGTDLSLPPLGPLV